MVLLLASYPRQMFRCIKAMSHTSGREEIRSYKEKGVGFVMLFPEEVRGVKSKRTSISFS